MTTRLADIIAIAARLSNISEAHIKSKQRFKHITRVRQAVAYVAVQQAKHSTPAIGRALGGRDHSTIIHAHRIVPVHMEYDPDYAAFVDRLQRETEAADPFLESWGEQFEFSLPKPPKPKPAPKQRRPMFASPPEKEDGGMLFHAKMAEGSAKLLAALRQCA